jgi:hypothetical protein
MLHATQASSFRLFLSREAKMKWIASLFGVAILALATTAMAADVELSIYYPVAVGGPITKIVDGFAADFEKENPGIKICRHVPRYSGKGANRVQEW